MEKKKFEEFFSNKLKDEFKISKMTLFTVLFTYLIPFFVNSSIVKAVSSLCDKLTACPLTAVIISDIYAS